MANITHGMHQLKSKIIINAPVEVCYQAWLEARHLPDVMHRVHGLQNRSMDNIAPITSTEEIQAKAQQFREEDIPLSRIMHWVVSGPGGKLYEFENATILEIQNHFICTASVHPDDLSVQSSVSFSPNDINTDTGIEWQVSFWVSSENGILTQFASDILAEGDLFLEECLQDFKRYVEDK